MLLTGEERCGSIVVEGIESQGLSNSPASAGLRTGRSKD